MKTEKTDKKSAKANESFLSIFAKAIMSGILIGVGGIVYLKADNKYMGAFLFSLGLFTIIQFGFALYTGKVGYIPERKPIYIREVLITLLGNIVGTAAAAGLILLTKSGTAVHEAAAVAMEGKLNDTIQSRFILGIFCGMLMYIAVENAAKCRVEGTDTKMVFGTVLPVMVFIISGFNHSVADCFYFFAAYPTLDGVVYILTVALGNAVGGMLIPLMKKLFDKA
ncbi:MAG: formate/nitrite transporter family protein [Oscillospiraceae bacterium]